MARAKVYGMLGSHAFKPACDEHAMLNGDRSRTIMQLNV